MDKNTGSRNSVVNKKMMSQRFGFENTAHYGAIQNQNESDECAYGVGANPASHCKTILTNKNTNRFVQPKAKRQSILRKIEFLKMELKKEAETHRIKMEQLEREFLLNTQQNLKITKSSNKFKGDDSYNHFGEEKEPFKIDADQSTNYKNEHVNITAEPNDEHFGFMQLTINAERVRKDVITAAEPPQKEAEIHNNGMMMVDKRKEYVLKIQKSQNKLENRKNEMPFNNVEPEPNNYHCASAEQMTYEESGEKDVLIAQFKPTKMHEVKEHTVLLNRNYAKTEERSNSISEVIILTAEFTKKPNTNRSLSKEALNWCTNANLPSMIITQVNNHKCIRIDDRWNIERSSTMLTKSLQKGGRDSTSPKTKLRFSYFGNCHDNQIKSFVYAVRMNQIKSFVQPKVKMKAHFLRIGVCCCEIHW